MSRILESIVCETIFLASNRAGDLGLYISSGR
jgi:hypothetical protein